MIHRLVVYSPSLLSFGAVIRTLIFLLSPGFNVSVLGKNSTQSLISYSLLFFSIYILYLVIFLLEFESVYSLYPPSPSILLSKVNGVILTYAHIFIDKNKKIKILNISIPSLLFKIGRNLFLLILIIFILIFIFYLCFKCSSSYV